MIPPFSFIKKGVPAPALSTISIDVADSGGGGTVALTGTNLGSATSCTVGGTSATITSNSSTVLRFTMPAKSVGSYSVVVTTAGGASNALTIYVEATPLVWLSADRATTSSGAVTGVTNSSISAVDLSVTQATGANRPTFNSSYSALNNQPAIVQSGGNLWLESAVLGSAVSQSFTVYQVFLMTTVANYLFDDGDGTSRVAYLIAGGVHPYLFAGADLNTAGTISANTAYCTCAVYNGLSSAVYLNDPSTAVLSGNAGSNSLKSLTVGNRYTKDTAMAGAWGTLAAFGGAHDSTTRTRIMGRLKAYYGIS